MELEAVFHGSAINIGLLHTHIHTYMVYYAPEGSKTYNKADKNTQLNIWKNIIHKRTKKYTKLSCKNTIHYISHSFIMRPSSLGGAAYCVALCLSVRPSRARMHFVYICTVLRANIQNRKTSVFDYTPASRM